jgi:hypothetical protein
MVFFPKCVFVTRAFSSTASVKSASSTLADSKIVPLHTTQEHAWQGVVPKTFFFRYLETHTKDVTLVPLPLPPVTTAPDR